MDTLTITVERERDGSWPIVAAWQQPGRGGPAVSIDAATVTAELEQALLAARLEPRRYGATFGINFD